MPFIELKTSAAISQEKEVELKTAFGQAITLIPAKSEQWLMLNFCGNQQLWFKVTNEPSAMLEVKIYGSASAENYNNLTEKLTEIVSELLAVPSGRIYIKYEEVDYWGYAGSNF